MYKVYTFGAYRAESEHERVFFTFFMRAVGKGGHAFMRAVGKGGHAFMRAVDKGGPALYSLSRYHCTG